MSDQDNSARIAVLEAELARLRAAPHDAALRSQRLSTREALLAEAERVAHLGSWSWDLATGAIEWSDEMFRILGFAPGSVTPSSELFFGAIDPSDRARVQAEAQATLASGRTNASEFRVRRSDGVRKLRLEAALLSDDQGRRSHIVGTVPDLTDSERSAELLFRTVEELRAAQQVARLASFTCTLDPPLIEWSTGMYTLLGLRGSETPSEELFRSHVHPEDLPYLLSKRAETLEHGIAEPIEFRLLTRDGAVLHVALECKDLRDASGSLRGFRGVIQDITRRRLLEDQLRHAHKMEAIGTLAGGVAHDFNNYLMILAGQAELVRDALGPGHPALASVASILDVCDRCAALTGQLLTLSRRRRAELQPLDLSATLRRLMPVLHTALGEAIDVVFDDDDAQAVALVDPGQLEQVLMNLSFNARDAMPNGGTLTLRVERVLHDSPSPGSDARSGSYLRLSVSDTGQGIAPEHLERVFEPFFTTKGSGHGTGLGLSTVYGIVEQAGGHIQVESELGYGTTFQLYFRPASEAPSEPPPPPSERPSSFVARRVLVVEDVQEVRALLRVQLERAGHAVAVAEHGAQALELMAHAREPIDVVVSDVVMPVMGGLELERKLAAAHPGIPCILMTGYADPVQLERSLARRVLRKPFPIRRLLEAVERMCAQAARRSEH